MTPRIRTTGSRLAAGAAVVVLVAGAAVAVGRGGTSGPGNGPASTAIRSRVVSPRTLIALQGDRSRAREVDLPGRSGSAWVHGAGRAAAPATGTTQGTARVGLVCPRLG